MYVAATSAAIETWTLAERRGRGPGIGVRGGDTARDAAEDVRLPARVEAGLIRRLTGSLSPGLAALRRRAGVDGRQQAAPPSTSRCARDCRSAACARAHVGVRLQRLRHQRRELRIVEALPPFGERRGAAESRRSRCSTPRAPPRRTGRCSGRSSSDEHPASANAAAARRGSKQRAQPSCEARHAGDRKRLAADSLIERRVGIRNDPTGVDHDPNYGAHVV